MTKAHSFLDDNRGLCESCDDPKTRHETQTAVPVVLGGGLGLGTMWMCPTCKAENDAKLPDGAVPAGSTRRLP